jgi:hypothetical protein
MEVRDGFIVGIFNYCDRWCETCRFTSRCRLFADVAKIEATHDPGLREVVAAPPLPEEIPPPLPPWMTELIQEMNDAAHDPEATDAFLRMQPTPPPEHQIVEARADSYCTQTHAWLRARAESSEFSRDPRDPLSVINWFHLQILVKVHRALHGLAEDERDREWPRDADGSAKVALVGIDRSHAAWLDLVDRGTVTPAQAAPFIEDLAWLGDALERAFPNARAFVRPGLDEPDEVALLLAREGGAPG